MVLKHIFSELYTSDTFIVEHEKLCAQQPHETGSNLEPVIIAIMLWSDSTHLANFGTASLWLIYLYIGNQSKYAQGKPTSFAAHHLAYIPKVLFFHTFFHTFLFIHMTTLKSMTVSYHDCARESNS